MVTVLRVGRGARFGSAGPSSAYEREPEARDLSQNGTFELLQLLARIDAELVDEDPACVLVGGEGFRLAARPVEREHELCTRTLAIAMRRHERLELNDDVRVATQLELGLDEILARRQLELLEASDGGVGERLESEVGERGPRNNPSASRSFSARSAGPSPRASETSRSKRATSTWSRSISRA